MKRIVPALGVIFASAVLVCSTSVLMAEQIRYMDSSGNIRFVDRVSQVPRQYLLQVVTPTPTPFIDKKGFAEIKKRQREEEAEKVRKEKERQRELRKRKEQLERERQREERDLRRRDDARKVNRLG